jgi:L-iditol 2-dehydrogenase
MGTGKVTLPIALLQTREIVLTGSFRYANCYTAAIALVQQGMVQLSPLIGPHFSLERTEEALLASRGDPRVIKAFVCPVID